MKQGADVHNTGSTWGFLSVLLSLLEGEVPPDCKKGEDGQNTTQMTVAMGVSPRYPPLDQVDTRVSWRTDVGTRLYKEEGDVNGRLCVALPGSVHILSGLPIHPPALPILAFHSPHSFSFTVTKSPRKETLSVDVERRRLPVEGSMGPGAALGTLRRTASSR